MLLLIAITFPRCSHSSQQWPRKAGWALTAHVSGKCGDRRCWLEGVIWCTHLERWGCLSFLSWLFRQEAGRVWIRHVLREASHEALEHTFLGRMRRLEWCLMLVRLCFWRLGVSRYVGWFLAVVGFLVG